MGAQVIRDIQKSVEGSHDLPLSPKQAAKTINCVRTLLRVVVAVFLLHVCVAGVVCSWVLVCICVVSV